MEIKNVQGIEYAQVFELWTYNETIVVVCFAFGQHKNNPCTNCHGLLLLLDNIGTMLALIVMEFSKGGCLGVIVDQHLTIVPHILSCWLFKE